MLKKNIIAISILSGAFFLNPVSAEDYYAGGNFAFLKYSGDEVVDGASLNTLVGRLGMNFNEYFSGEIRIGLGLGDETISLPNIDAGFTVELDRLLGVYLRGGIPVTESFFPYILLGYTDTEATGRLEGFNSDTSSESDISYGLGADLSISEKITLNAEYTNYYDKDGVDIRGFSIGVTTKF